MTGDLVGVFVLTLQIALTASRNQLGGVKESSGPRRGAGKNDWAFPERNSLSPSTSEQTPIDIDSPMTAASLAFAALSRWASERWGFYTHNQRVHFGTKIRHVGTLPIINF